MSPFINLFRRYLREQGLPVTQQREAVADVVFSSTGHLSVEDIEAELKGQGERIGKATIYRTMEMSKSSLRHTPMCHSWLPETNHRGMEGTEVAEDGWTAKSPAQRGRGKDKGHDKM